MEDINEKMEELSRVIFDRNGEVAFATCILNGEPVVEVDLPETTIYVDMHDMVWITDEGLDKYRDHCKKEKDIAERASFSKNTDKRKRKRSPKSFGHSRFTRSS